MRLIERMKALHEEYINRYGVVGGNVGASAVKRCISICGTKQNPHLIRKGEDKKIMNEIDRWEYFELQKERDTLMYADDTDYGDILRIESQMDHLESRYDDDWF